MRTSVPLKVLAQLGWRNLWRHRRRNVMLLSAIVLAVAFVLLANSLLRGWQAQMLDTVVANLTGHVKVLAPGYRDDPSIQRGFEIPAEYQPVVPGMEGWTSRVRVPGVILSERDTRGVMLVGVDPAQELAISFLADVTVEGEYLQSPADRRVLIGAALAEQLETRVGRRIVLMTQGSDGRNREAGYRIAGIYRASSAGLEKAFAFTGREVLQDLLDSRAVTELSVRLQENGQRTVARESLQRQFGEQEASTWDELEPMAASMYRFADTAMLIWFSVMMTALAFGLVNTLVTAVMERTRELGMLRAIGMQPGVLLLQVVMESLMIVSLGVVLGIGLGMLAVQALSGGIDLSQWTAGIESYYMGSVLVPVLLPYDIVRVLALSLLFGLVASAFPAWRAVRVEPLDAMRR